MLMDLVILHQGLSICLTPWLVYPRWKVTVGSHLCAFVVVRFKNWLWSRNFAHSVLANCEVVCATICPLQLVRMIDGNLGSSVLT